MEIRSLAIFRDNNRIYEKLAVKGLASNQTLSVVFDETIVPTPTPCILFAVSSNEFVAVSPDLGISRASYVLAATDPVGRTTERVAHVIPYKSASQKPLIGRSLPKKTIDELRGYDEKCLDQLPDVDLKVEKVTSSPRYMYFRINLRFPGALFGTMRIILQKEDNLQILASDFTPMGSRVIPPVGPGAGYDHEINVTVKVPWDAENIIAYAWEEERPNILAQQQLRKSKWEPMRLALDRLIYENAGRDPLYEDWLRRSRADRHTIARQKQVQFECEPKFSFIVPLRRTSASHLDTMIASVKSQSYANWECVLVKPLIFDEQINTCIRNYIQGDKRIEVVTFAKGLVHEASISAGVAHSTGDYICFLGQDDTIEPDALFEYAKALNTDPSIDLLYCDEDKLLADEHHVGAQFKPDFNLDLLRSNNYIRNMLCVRANLLKQVMQSSNKLDDAQGYGIALQASENSGVIHHVAKILYHCRPAESPISSEASTNPHAASAGLRALQTHLTRTGICASATMNEKSNAFSVRYAVPDPAPLVSVIIPTSDHVGLLRTCVGSVLGKTTYGNFEVVVVENNSREPETFAYYEEASADPRVRVCRWEGEGFNFSELVNFGRERARGEYLLLLNNDTEVITPDWMERMVGNAARPEVGCVGAKLYYPDETIQHAGIVIAEDPANSFQGLPREEGGYLDLANKQRNVVAVTGACLMVSAELFDEAGGFDPELAVAYNDVDFCLKVLKQGKLNVYVPDVELYHYESVSRGFDEDPEDRKRFYVERETIRKRWAEDFGFRDPYYNTGLVCRIPEAGYYRLQ